MGKPTETNSLEVRWFGDGPPPPALGEWLSELGPIETEQRTDLYFPPIDSALNLKLRGGGDAVEVKYRLGSGAHREFGPDVAGTVEQWYKWGFPLEHTPRLWTSDSTGLWFPVEKTRLLYAFERSEIRSFDDRIADTDVEAHVEVTEVTALSNTGWTCCLEVAGPPDELDDVVTIVGESLFGESFPVELPADLSLGYVAWFRRLTADLSPAAAVLVPSNR